MSDTLHKPCRAFDQKKAAGSVVGSIVVDVHEVSFYAFKANTADVLHHNKTAVGVKPIGREGWAEQDPMKILDAVNECVKSAVDSCDWLAARVTAVGIANHRCTVVAWDKRTGVPLYNAILWSDNRTAPMVGEYLREHDKYRFQRVCGLPFSPYFSAFKIKWLVDNVPSVKMAFACGHCYFGTIDSWLVWNLTGGKNGGMFATDSSNASNTFLMNINTLKWDEKLLKFFGLYLNCLPEIKTSSEMYGHFCKGPFDKIPITGVVGIRQAAVIGHKCFQRGQTKAIFDDSATIFSITGDNKVFSKNGLITTIGYHLNDSPVFALEGPIASAGISIEWTKKCFNVNESECFGKNNQNIRNHVYLVPAFNGLYAPQWRSEARTIIVGLDEEMTKIDVLKGAMESVCFQTQDVLEALFRDLKLPIDKIKVDGELSNSNRFVMQFLSDITHAQVEVTEFKGMAALGAAMAAGYAPEINVWNILSMADDMGISYVPKLSIDQRKVRIDDWKKASRKSYGSVDDNHKSKFNNYWVTIPLPILSGLLLLGGYWFLMK